MVFAALDKALNAAVFDHLSDDPEALWSRGVLQIARLPAILDAVERPSTQRGLALMETITVVRLPLDTVTALGLSPQSGDVLTVDGSGYAIRGAPWIDTAKGRDWVCPVDAL